MPPMFIRRLLVTGAMLTATTATVLASGALARTGTPTVQFFATGPAGLKIVGAAHDLDVQEDGEKLRVSVPLANLDTGIALRNKHMREKYLEVGKFPRADLSVSRADLRIPAEAGETSGEAAATMLIHGIAKPVRFMYRVRRDGSGLHVTGSTRVNINEHGIAVPSYLGVTVKPDVDISAAFDATE